MLPFVLLATGGLLGYKAGVVLIDEDYPGDVVPEAIRTQIIQEHIRAHGWKCPRCGKRRYELQVDHKIPLAKGGRNSRQNLQVLCGDCNRRKGASYGFGEWLTGRFQ